MHFAEIPALRVAALDNSPIERLGVGVKGGPICYAQDELLHLHPVQITSHVVFAQTGENDLHRRKSFLLEILPDRVVNGFKLQEIGRHHLFDQAVEFLVQFQHILGRQILISVKIMQDLLVDLLHIEISIDQHPQRGNLDRGPLAGDGVAIPPLQFLHDPAVAGEDDLTVLIDAALTEHLDQHILVLDVIFDFAGALHQTLVFLP